MPAMKKPVFTQQSDTVFVRYKELYQAETMNLQWSMTSDSVASIQVTIVNSRNFSFDQQNELNRMGLQFSREFTPTIQNAAEFSSISIAYTWKTAILTRTFTTSYELSSGIPDSTAGILQSPATSATATRVLPQ